jgi:NitT/TauT family transport system permease protein
MKIKSILKNLIYPFIVIGIILIIWAIAAKQIGSEFILPSINTTLSQLKKLLFLNSFWLSFSKTLLRCLFTFFISFFLAMFFAILSKFFKTAKLLLSPLVSITRVLPTMAIILLLIIWTNSTIAPIIIAIIVVFPTLYSQFLGEIMGIDEKLLDMSKVYKVPKMKVLTKFYIPQMLPVIVMAVGAGLSLSLKLLVAAEVLAQTVNSIGGMMQTAKMYFETGQLMALTIITVITGILFEILASLFKPLWRWK